MTCQYVDKISLISTISNSFPFGNQNIIKRWIMNIQIFGTKKSSDTRKAERFFKERGIKFQSVDLSVKGLSKRELESVIRAAGSIEAVLDENCKDKDVYLLIKYLEDSAKFDKLLENPTVLIQPIVRNGQQATVGYMPEIWKTWE